MGAFFLLSLLMLARTFVLISLQTVLLVSCYVKIFLVKIFQNDSFMNLSKKYRFCNAIQSCLVLEIFAS